MRDVTGNNTEELDCYPLHNACVEGHDCAQLLIKKKGYHRSECCGRVRQLAVDVCCEQRLILARGVTS